VGNSAGVIEYVLDDRVEGWVRWDESSVQRELVLVEVGSGDVASATLSARPGDMPFAQKFRIERAGVSIESLSTGRHKVVARFDGREVQLPLWQILKMAYEEYALTDKQKSAYSFWRASVEGRNTDGLKVAPQPLEGFGAVSADGDAIVGRNGYLFLGEGSNRVSELYQKEYPGKAAEWTALFLRRKGYAEAADVAYLQMVVPEKSSVIPQLCPFPATTPSHLLASLRESLSSSADFDTPVVFPFLDSAADRVFSMADSHLSAEGCLSLLDSIVAGLGGELPRLEVAWKDILLKGDLGGKFSGDWREWARVAGSVSVRGVTLEPKLVRVADPVGGGHRGIERVWRNETAPIDLRVVAFANSFFERGVLSTQLSWWCARLFSEFHFIWSPALRAEYVEEVKPDAVICQTIERFLRVVPEA